MFIIDTGAAVSVIDSSQASRFQLTLQEDSTTSTGAGAGGQVEVIPSNGNKIEIGNHIVTDFTLAVMSFEHVSQALRQEGSEEFLGAIGVDILKPGKAIIDYSTMTLYLSPEK